MFLARSFFSVIPPNPPLKSRLGGGKRNPTSIRSSLGGGNETQHQSEVGWVEGSETQHQLASGKKYGIKNES